MPSRLYLCPFGYQEATRLLFKEVLDRKPGPPDYSFLTYIAPTPRKVRAAQLDFMELVGRPALIPPTFVTLNQFVREIHARQGRLRRFSPELRVLLLMRLMGEARPGYARAVGDFIELLRQYRPDLDPPKLKTRVAELLADFDDPRHRALQTADAMEKYLALLAARGWADDETIMLAIAASPDRIIGVNSHLILDGFYDLTRPQEEILTRIMNEARDVTALGWFDPQAANEYTLVRGFESFLKQARPGFETVMLNTNRPIRTDPACRQYHSREEEVEAIARDIKLKLHSGELDSSRTIVVFPGFRPYAAIVKRTFLRYGLPHTIYPDVNLAASPPMVAVLQLLEAIRDDFPRIPFVSALMSPWFGRVSPALRANVNRFSLKAGILKGEHDWRFLRQRVIDREGPDPEPPVPEGLNAVQEELNLILGLCATFARRQDTMTGHIERLKSLLAQLEWTRQLDPEHPDEAEYMTHRRLLYSLLDEVTAFEASLGPAPCSLDEFIRTLGYLVSNLPAPPERELSGILVCSTLESRGLDCDFVYYGGLIEGELPSRFKHDPILPDWVRRKLGLPYLDRHNDWQRLHFFRLVNTPARTAWLSYPDTEEDTLLLPTPFLDTEPIQPDLSAGILSVEEAQRQDGVRSDLHFEEQLLSFTLDRDSEVTTELARRFAPEKPISVTTLESYRYCPFRFYIEQVLQLETFSEPEYKLEPTQWGTVFHRALEALYRDGAVAPEAIPEKLRTILPGVLSREGVTGFWRQVFIRVFEADLPDLVAIETGFRNEGFAPINVERRVQTWLSASLHIRGRLDRTDQSPAGLRILDYKTGKSQIRAIDVLKHGTHVQLPLYALMLGEQKPGVRVLNAGIFDLRLMTVNWLADEKTRLSDLIQAARANAIAIADLIRGGRFADPPSGACWQCAMKFLCPAAAASSSQPQAASRKPEELCPPAQ
jgi:ATP-dependent helicase/DNAse subunit B